MSKIIKLIQFIILGLIAFWLFTGVSNAQTLVRVPQGGTGTSTVPTGLILFGNSSSSLSTSQALYWNSISTRLGVGSSSPLTALHVLGLSTQPSSELGTFVITTTSSAARLAFGVNTAGLQYGWIQSVQNGIATRPLILNGIGGNVGINTTAPTQQLTVQGSILFTGGLMPSGTAGTLGQVLLSNGVGVAPSWVSTSSLGFITVTAGNNLTGTSTLSVVNSPTFEGLTATGTVSLATTTASTLTVSSTTTQNGQLILNAPLAPSGNAGTIYQVLRAGSTGTAPAFADIGGLITVGSNLISFGTSTIAVKSNPTFSFLTVVGTSTFEGATFLSATSGYVTSRDALFGTLTATSTVSLASTTLPYLISNGAITINSATPPLVGNTLYAQGTILYWGGFPLLTSTPPSQVAVQAINGVTATSQFISLNSAGLDFLVSTSATGTILSLPDTSATARGVINTTTQTIAGAKTFLGLTELQNTTTAYSIVPATTTTYDLGSPSLQFRSLYVSSSTIYIANIPLSVVNTSTLYWGGLGFAATTVSSTYLTALSATTTNLTVTGTSVLATTTIAQLTLGSLLFTSATGTSLTLTTASSINARFTFETTTNLSFGAATGTTLILSSVLGIGTTTPTTAVSAVIAGVAPIIRFYDTNQNTTNGSYDFQSSGGALSVYRGVLGLSGAEKLKIDANTTSVNNFGVKNTAGGVLTGSDIISLASQGVIYFNNGRNFGIGTTTPLATLTVQASTSPGDVFSINSSTGAYLTTINGRGELLTTGTLGGTGTAPTVAAGAGAGVGAAVTISSTSTNVAGNVFVTVGTPATKPVNSPVFTVTFSVAQSQAPKCIFTPSNDTANTYMVANITRSLTILSASTTQTSFSVHTNNSLAFNAAAAAVHQYTYHCLR